MARTALPEGVQALAAEYRMSNCGDAWGSCMGWLFSIADYRSDQGLEVPEDWGYRQAMGGPDREQYEFQALEALAPSEADLDTFGAMLWRLRGILKAAGRDY